MGGDSFELEFDFIDHRLLLRTSSHGGNQLVLESMSVAEFYRRVMLMLRAAGIDLLINTMPQEVMEPIRFEDDTQHSIYDEEYSHRHWRILLQVDRLIKQFRSRFIGKCSPIHFFWGSFDLLYEHAPASSDPDQYVLGFFESTYGAGAELGRWDRSSLERAAP